VKESITVLWGGSSSTVVVQVDMFGLSHGYTVIEFTLIPHSNELLDGIKTYASRYNLSELFELVVEVFTGRLLQDVEGIEIDLVIESFNSD
jgi:hypothetical protein